MWQCWAALAACVGVLFGGYFLQRSHAKLDRSGIRDVTQQIVDSWNDRKYAVAIIFAISWGMKTFLTTGLLGGIVAISVAGISGICGGLTFDQVKRLSCIWGEVISGKIIQSCQDR